MLVDRDHVSLKVMEWRATRVVNMWSENTAENRLSLAGVPIERCDAVLLKFRRLKLITTTRVCVSNETVEFDVALNPAGRVPDIQGIIEEASAVEAKICVAIFPRLRRSQHYIDKSILALCDGTMRMRFGIAVLPASHGNVAERGEVELK